MSVAPLGDVIVAENTNWLSQNMSVGQKFA